MNKIFYIILLLNVSVLGQSQFSWQWQNPLPQGNTIYKLFFLNNDEGFAIGRNGIFLTTTDGGNNWNSFSPRFGAYEFRDFHFLNEYTGIIVCDSGKIIKTDDGGITWEDKSSGTARSILTVTFVNDSTGYAAGNNNTILKTIDAGETWESKFEDSIHYFFNSIFFLTAEKGFVGGNGGKLFFTEDGGENWTALITPDNFWTYGLFFLNDSSGFISGVQGKIFKTTDAGYSWSPVSSGTTYWLKSIFFVDESAGYAVGTGGAIIKTTDKGSSWNNVSTISNINLEHVYFISDTGYVAGINGSLYKTTDAGSSWINLRKGADGLATGPQGYYDHLRSLYFLNSVTGYAVGERSTILKTTNGGLNWFTQQSDTAGPGGWFLYSVYFVNEDTGFIAGDYGHIERTTDGGESWVRQNTGTTEWLKSVQFVNSQTGFVSGTGLLKTTDAGASWVRYPTPPDNYTNDAFFLDEERGFVTVYGRILKTTDGGINWEIKLQGVSANLNKIRFSDDNNGIVAGNNGKIYKTSDGGETWESSGDYDIYYNFKTVSIIDSDIIFIAGDKNPYIGGGGLIIKSTDGGETWNEQVSYASNSLTDIFFTNASTGYAAGIFGTILKTVTSGEHPYIITSVNDEITNNVTSPEAFIVHQNYPNPFNPETIISFYLDEETIVTLDIFDILGRKVDTITNQFLTKGNYTYKWNAGKFPTGIYFYRISAGNKNQIKKMLLIK
jgi:photosystem II stability/assembly factor-like uncharacterized protein